MLGVVIEEACIYIYIYIDIDIDITNMTIIIHIIICIITTTTTTTTVVEEALVRGRRDGHPGIYVDWAQPRRA